MQRTFLLALVVLICIASQSRSQNAPTTQRITIKLYYLQGKGLLQAFKKENDQDPSSLAVRQALQQTGFKVRVSAQEFDQNKQPVGNPQSKDFELKVTGENVEFVGDSKTAIFIDVTPKEKSFYALTVDAPPVGGGASIFEPVTLPRLHIEKMEISVVMPVANATQPLTRKRCCLFGSWCCK